MGSSGSTPSRTAEPGPRLLLRVAGEDHPKACTGRKLLRLGLATRLDGPVGRGPAPVLLDPHAEVPLSRADRPRAEAAGILGVDCSWNRLGVRGGYPGAAAADHRSVRRRLPYLLAGNPQHFGRLAELNTAEALGAALWIVGEPERARALLAGFPGGSAFLALNAGPLERYLGCGSAEEIRAVERDFF